MLQTVFEAIADSALAAWVNSSAMIWPMLETVHFVSLCAFMGFMLVIDLRLIGLFRDRCASLIVLLVRLSLLAFAVNAATGLLFFFGNTFKYVNNPAFELKLILITLAALNAVYFRLRLSRLVDTNEVSVRSVAVGVFSLALWSGVIICGRMITFFAR